MSDTQIISVPDLVHRAKTILTFAAPDVICLCIKGNLHNSLGIFESPTAISIGADEADAQGLNDPSRSFIPFNVMVDHFFWNTDPTLIGDLFAAFPDALRAYMNPPPPIGDWDHILSNPGPFADQIKNGPAPKTLRRQLYRAQTTAMRRIADLYDAAFLMPPASMMEEEGFLLKEFWGNDPTHANADYGSKMLYALKSLAQDLCARRDV
jgi:hypothetical protein